MPKKKEPVAEDRRKVEAWMYDIARSADHLDAILKGVRAITQHLPERTSARQLEAILLVMRANAMGKTITMTDLRAAFGDVEGVEKVAQSLARTFQMFMVPPGHDPGALGWVEQEIDPDDRRKKYLVLTQDGMEVVRDLRETMSAREKVTVGATKEPSGE